MSHSPLPWGFMGQLIVSDCDRKIAELEFSDRMVDDRNLIVTAVNNHAKLALAINEIMLNCEEWSREKSDMSAYELIEIISHVCKESLLNIGGATASTHVDGLPVRRGLGESA